MDRVSRGLGVLGAGERGKVTLLLRRDMDVAGGGGGFGNTPLGEGLESRFDELEKVGEWTPSFVSPDSI